MQLLRVNKKIIIRLTFFKIYNFFKRELKGTHGILITLGSLSFIILYSLRSILLISF